MVDELGQDFDLFGNVCAREGDREDVIADAGRACAIQQPPSFAQVIERLMALTT